jgi:hypothetical protein
VKASQAVSAAAARVLVRRYELVMLLSAATMAQTSDTPYTASARISLSTQGWIGALELGNARRHCGLLCLSILSSTFVGAQTTKLPHGASYADHESRL